MTPKKNALVDKWFHSPSTDENGAIVGLSWQGQVLGEVGPGRFLVQTYSYLDGSPHTQRVVSIDAMGDWIFYDSDDEMRFSGERGVAHRWDMLGERKRAEPDGPAGVVEEPRLRKASDIVRDVVEGSEHFEERERKFRIGAHHAATRLAEALEAMKTVDACRKLADAFADEIGLVRPRIDDDFDLNAIMRRAQKKVGP